MPLFGLESSRLLSPDLGPNSPFLKGLKFKNRWFRPARARPSRGGSSSRGNFSLFAVVCRSSAGKRRALLERERVHIVLRPWLQQIGVRVRTDQSLSGGFSRRPRVCLCVCFRLPKAIWSILQVIICLSQRLIRERLSSHCSTVKQTMAH